MAELINLSETHSLFVVAVKLFEDNFGDIDGFLDGDPILHDLSDIFESYLLLLIQSFEDNLYIIYNILSIDNLVDSAVHIHETLKV